MTLTTLRTAGAPFRAAARLASANVLELTAIGGAAAVTHGVDLVCRPAAFVVGGGFALFAAWRAARPDVVLKVG